MTDHVRPSRSAHARKRSDNIEKIEAAAAGTIPPAPYDCLDCGLRITSGLPCGCREEDRPQTGRYAALKPRPSAAPDRPTGSPIDDGVTRRPPAPPAPQPAAKRPKIEHDDRRCISAAVDFVRYGMEDRRCAECRKWHNGKVAP